MQGSLYWELLRVLAAIWLVRLGWRTAGPGVATGLGEAPREVLGVSGGWGGWPSCGPGWELWELPTMDTLLMLGHRGLVGTVLTNNNRILDNLGNTFNFVV